MAKNKSIPTIYYPNNSERTIVFVGGSGDDKDKFKDIYNKLLNGGVDYNILAFSALGLEEGNDLPLHQQVEDLQKVLDYIVDSRNNIDITIVCTSSGAYSVGFILASNYYNKFIHDAILLDPADYYFPMEVSALHASTWTGNDKYEFSERMVSALYKKIRSKTKVHVINFLLRNYSPNGYTKISQRGDDNPKYKERLNNNMVRMFYDNTPEKNKGLYIEDQVLPHAFMRDGDIKRNVKRVVELIEICLRIKCSGAET